MGLMGAFVVSCGGLNAFEILFFMKDERLVSQATVSSGGTEVSQDLLCFAVH